MLMLNATHLAMKNKLQGLTLPGKNNTTITVDASYSRPEEWIKTRIPPALNVNCVMTKFDPTRHTIDYMYSYADSTKQVIHAKRMMTPFLFFYEIRFITALGQHNILLSEQILKRLPPLGFGGYLEIPFDTAVIECPFVIEDERDIFFHNSRVAQTTELREFEDCYRYKVFGWQDTYDTIDLKTINTVNVNILEGWPD